MIFSTVFGPQEPAFTVGSLAISATGRPRDRRHAGHDAVGAEAVLLPVREQRVLGERVRRRRSRATRSRTGSLPCSRDFSWWRSGPPPRARSSASFRSDMGSNVSAGGAQLRPQGAADQLERGPCAPPGRLPAPSRPIHIGASSVVPNASRPMAEAHLEADQHRGDVARLHVVDGSASRPTPPSRCNSLPQTPWHSYAQKIAGRSGTWC